MNVRVLKIIWSWCFNMRKVFNITAFLNVRDLLD